jgi:hypothetical protein
MSKDSSSSIRQDIIPIAVAIIVTFILFWMDEGYYDLRWMKNIAGWVMFLFYTGGLVLGELMVSSFLFAKQPVIRKTVLTVVAGIPLGLLFTALSIYGMGALIQLVY